MRLSRVVFVVVIAISAAKLTQAQQPIWIPQGIEALPGASEPFHTRYSSKLDPGMRTCAA